MGAVRGPSPGRPATSEMRRSGRPVDRRSTAQTEPLQSFATRSMVMLWSAADHPPASIAFARHDGELLLPKSFKGGPLPVTAECGNVGSFSHTNLASATRPQPNAWFRSAIRSSGSSIPTEMRISACVIYPAAIVLLPECPNASSPQDAKQASPYHPDSPRA